METNINTQVAGGKKPSLLGMITSPGVQFERMKTKSPVWVAFLLFVLIGTVTTAAVFYLSTINTPEVAKELNGQDGQMIKWFALGGGALFGLVGTPIGLFIAAGFYKVIMMLMGNDTPYMKILSIYLYANLVFYIGSLLNVGLGLIFDGNGTDAYTSLAPLFEKGTVLNGIASSIEIFNIWSLILTGLGLHIVAGLSKKQATILIVIFFILTIGLGFLKGLGNSFGA
ncbi:YIP1 family protein [Bacillus sp. CH126_4D]|uniref:Yip1 family protein n=1 Tax=unclassified Bacillus (in: firmicutes) TaxID=185979 RepID=UPI00124E4AD9|nr:MULTISPECIES: Yip1 family protein [unclassified Bacillus (in: firmicutes)]KAB2451285.1 YIP1 family protein [Bacillus sp. CH140a_4T]KAB2472097.1 YIP1 family protein [Bacillus sp. CH126_4D]